MADFWVMAWVTISGWMTQRKCVGGQGDKWLMGVIGYHLCIYGISIVVKNGSQQREWRRLYTHDLERPYDP